MLKFLWNVSLLLFWPPILSSCLILLDFRIRTERIIFINPALRAAAELLLLLGVSTTSVAKVTRLSFYMCFPSAFIPE